MFTKRSLFTAVVNIALVLVMAVAAQASNITGTIVTPTGSFVSNGTLTFSLNQAGIQPGVYSIVSSPVACYTSTNGGVVGLPNPVVAALATGSTASGSIPAGTYYVRVTYITTAAATETLASPAAVIVLGATGRFDVTAPVLQPAGAAGYRVYAGTVSGSEKLQATVIGFGSTQITSYNGAAADDPTSNNSVCSLTFNDAIIPSFTFYTVSLTNSSGSAIPGFPQNWYLAGSSIDVSSQYPVAAVAQQTRFPTPILSNPSSNAQQSVNSPVTLNGYTLTAGPVSGSNISASGNVTSTGRLLETQGTNVTGINDLVLGTGNVFRITGATTINRIDTTNWQNGAVIRLVFSSNPTVTDGVAASGNLATLVLAGNVNFSATADDVLTLTLIDGSWYETSRSVN